MSRLVIAGGHARHLYPGGHIAGHHRFRPDQGGVADRTNRPRYA
jgi:hypothetical protein